MSRKALVPVTKIASNGTQPVRSLAAWMGLLALVIQTLVPPLHQAAQTMAGDGFLSRLVVLCTAEGPKVVSIADHGDAPLPLAPRARTQTCVLCVGHHLADASLPPRIESALDFLFGTERVAVPVASLTRDGNRRSPRYPRGPPVAV